VASSCVLTPTNRFCFTCERILRKATFAFMNGHETEEIHERLCEHAEVHQSEARVRKITMERYEKALRGQFSGPIIEVGTPQYEDQDG
jgi:hypothetical protein